MRIRQTLRPGQRGTKQLVAEHGDRLVCVRYRYDEGRGLRLKTIELIVDEAPWQPGVRRRKPRPDDIVALRIGREEHAIRERVKLLGGQFYARTACWHLRRDLATALGLEHRIVPGASHQP